jgi:DNA-binding PadR family transcriptional regulator
MKPLSLAQMVLGLLLDAPAHGYELRRCLAPFFGAGTPMNTGLLYPALAKLEARGWVTKRSVRQSRAPRKHVYSITPAGRRQVLAWLTRADGGQRPARYDFFHRDPLLARVALFRHLSDDQIKAMLRKETAEAEARCGDYTGVRVRMAARKVDPYRIRVLEFGLRYHRLRCAWIRELLDWVERGRRRRSPPPRRRR